MPDLNVLRDLGNEVQPPTLDSLRRTARRRNRRAAAAAVVACVTAVVVVIGGGALLVEGGERAAPKPATRPTTPTDKATPQRTAVHRLPLPKGFGSATPLDAGRYTVRLRNPDKPVGSLGAGLLVLAFDMDVPAGWQVARKLVGWASPSPLRPIFTPTSGSGGRGQLSVVYASLGLAIQNNPCHGKDFYGPRDIDAMAAAISRMQHVVVDTPLVTTVGGLDARSMTIRVRDGDDLSRCHDDRYDLFMGGDSDTSYFETVTADQAGDVVRVWLVELGDERLVFTAELPPDATGADADALTRMVESITFPR